MILPQYTIIREKHERRESTMTLATVHEKALQYGGSDAVPTVQMMFTGFTVRVGPNIYWFEHEHGVRDFVLDIGGHFYYSAASKRYIDV
jgi:hypothetical protein